MCFSDIVKPQCPHIDSPNCQSNEILCPDTKDENGCEGAGKCVASNELDNVGILCPAMCQLATCLHNEIFCPGIKDSTGCSSKGSCVKNNTIGNNGDLCEPICPITCNDNQIMCSGPYNSNGCKSEDYCIENEGILQYFFVTCHVYGI